MSFFQKMRDIFFSKEMSVILLLCSSALLFAVYDQYSRISDLTEFLDFAVGHKCEIVSREEGKTVPGFGHGVTSGGKIITGTTFFFNPTGRRISATTALCITDNHKKFDLTF